MGRPGDLFFYGVIAAIAIEHLLGIGWEYVISAGLVVGWYLNERIRIRGE